MTTSLDTSYITEIADRPPLAYTLGVLFSGKSITRAFLNYESKKYQLCGTVVDIGGGKHPNYHEMKCNEPLSYHTIDFTEPEHSAAHIDLEKDTLPFQEDSIDAVVALNILEHIFNHRHVLKEAHRILKPKAKLIGFVPFLMFVHPDPHDYFRYTDEALQKLFQDAGFAHCTIKVIGGGIFTAQFQLLVQSLPAWLRGIAWLLFGSMDWLYLKVRPQSPLRYPLGYFFTASKHGDVL